MRLFSPTRVNEIEFTGQDKDFDHEQSLYTALPAPESDGYPFQGHQT